MLGNKVLTLLRPVSTNNTVGEITTHIAYHSFILRFKGEDIVAQLAPRFSKRLMLMRHHMLDSSVKGSRRSSIGVEARDTPFLAICVVLRL